ncbi:MAG: hypothetical protein IPI57_18990 [Candidatus Competibacteraceae bacterium]|nr:hypothetical protein [Candidatus Competibacteraceae bacterium]
MLALAKIACSSFAETKREPTNAAPEKSARRSVAPPKSAPLNRALVSLTPAKLT